MSYKNIKTQSKNSIGTVTISREKEKNSLDIETSREIYESLVEFDNNNLGISSTTLNNCSKTIFKNVITTKN